MNTLLLILTIVSLAAAAGASAVAWRVTAETRRRSEARVARLADVLRRDEGTDTPPVPMVHLLEPRTDPPPVLVPVAAVAIGVTLVAAAFGLARAAADGPADPVAAARPAAARGPAGAPGAATTPGSDALALVALTHERTPAGTLEVRGEVRVARNGAMMEPMTAVALLFDPQGAYLASSRAPLSVRQETGGAVGSFAISVPDGGRVARYRVSFRRGDQIVPHLDRREVVSAEGGS